MTLYQLLCLLGIPGLLAALFARLKSLRALRPGLQALLRDRLLSEYREATRRGYAAPTDRDNFENLYHQYHRLGANGVMDDLRTRYFALPAEAPMKEGD